MLFLDGYDTLITAHAKDILSAWAAIIMQAPEKGRIVFAASPSAGPTKTGPGNSPK